MSFRWVILSLAVCLVSCSEYGDTDFVKSGGREENGVYRHVLDMTDTTVYSISLYSRLDCGSKTFAGLPEMKLNITLESPSGRRATETVFLPKDEFSPVSSFSFETVAVYRAGLLPREYGLWKMETEIVNGSDLPGVRGMGVILKKQGNGER